MPIKIKIFLTLYIILASIAVVFFEIFFGYTKLIYILFFFDHINDNRNMDFS